MGLIEDAKSIVKRDPAARNIWEVIFLYPGFKVLIYHRIANFYIDIKDISLQGGFHKEEEKRQVLKFTQVLK